MCLFCFVFFFVFLVCFFLFLFFFFSVVNGTAPSYLCDVLTPAASIHTCTRVNTSDNLLLVYMSNVICLSNILIEYKAPVL